MGSKKSEDVDFTGETLQSFQSTLSLQRMCAHTEYVASHVQVRNVHTVGFIHAECSTACIHVRTCAVVYGYK